METVSTFRFPNDILLVSPLTSQEDIGTFRDPGNFGNFDLLLGLPQTARSVIPSSVPGDHPLASRPDSMYLVSSEAYLALQMTYQLISGGVVTDTTTARIASDQSVPFGYSGLFTVPTGRDFFVPLTIDYAIWLAGLTGTADNDEVEFAIGDPGRTSHPGRIGQVLNWNCPSNLGLDIRLGRRHFPKGSRWETPLEHAFGETLKRFLHHPLCPAIGYQKKSNLPTLRFTLCYGDRTLNRYDRADLYRIGNKQPGFSGSTSSPQHIPEIEGFRLSILHVEAVIARSHLLLPLDESGK